MSVREGKVEEIKYKGRGRRNDKEDKLLVASKSFQRDIQMRVKGKERVNIAGESGNEQKGGRMKNKIKMVRDNQNVRIEKNEGMTGRDDIGLI